MEVMLYIRLEESLSSDYVLINKMFHMNELDNEYNQLAEILATHELAIPTLEVFKERFILVNVKYDGRKRGISEEDALKALESEGYLKRIGGSMFGGFYKRTEKIKVEKETISSRLLTIA